MPGWPRLKSDTELGQWDLRDSLPMVGRCTGNASRVLKATELLIPHRGEAFRKSSVTLRQDTSFNASGPWRTRMGTPSDIPVRALGVSVYPSSMSRCCEGHETKLLVEMRWDRFGMPSKRRPVELIESGGCQRTLLPIINGFGFRKGRREL